VIAEDTAPADVLGMEGTADVKAISALGMASDSDADNMVVDNVGRRHRDCEVPATEADHAADIGDTLDVSSTGVVWD